MKNAPQDDGKKRMTCFRLSPEARQMLCELVALTGRDKTRTVEDAIKRHFQYANVEYK